MKNNEKKYKGVYLDKNRNTYYVSTTFMTKDGFEVKKCKRGFKTQREANNWKEEQKVFFGKTNYSASGVVKTPTEILVEKYFTYKKKFCKPTFFKSISTNIQKHFTPFFKDKKLTDLTPFDIQEYYSWLASKKMKNQSKNIILSNVTGLIEWLDLMELIPPTVLRKFKLICVKFELVEEYQNSYLEYEEIKALLDSYGTSRDEKMLKLFAYMILTSGVRHSELRALRYCDIDYLNHTISVNKQLQFMSKEEILVPYTKTNKDKIIDVPTSLIEMILEMKQIDNADEGDQIFWYHGGVIKPSLALYFLKKHLKQAGVHSCTIHDLRHTYATVLFDTDFDEKYIAKQLGHSTPKTSHDIYEHLTKGKETRNKSKIEALDI